MILLAIALLWLLEVGLLLLIIGCKILIKKRGWSKKGILNGAKKVKKYIKKKKASLATKETMKITVKMTTIIFVKILRVIRLAVKSMRLALMSVSIVVILIEALVMLTLSQYLGIFDMDKETVNNAVETVREVQETVETVVGSGAE